MGEGVEVVLADERNPTTQPSDNLLIGSWPVGGRVRIYTNTFLPTLAPHLIRAFLHDTIFCVLFLNKMGMNQKFEMTPLKSKARKKGNKL